MEKHVIKWGGKIFVDIDYADDFKHPWWKCEQNEWTQGARIGLKINVKKTKSLRLGISEDERVTLGNKQIDQMDSFTYLGSTISKDGGSSEDVKSRMAKALGVFSEL